MGNLIKKTLFIILLFSITKSYCIGIGDSYDKILSYYQRIDGVEISAKSKTSIAFKLPEWMGYNLIFVFGEDNNCGAIIEYNTDFKTRMTESVEQSGGAKQLDGKFVNIKDNLVKVNIWSYKNLYKAYFTESPDLAFTITTDLKINLNTYIDYIVGIRNSD